MVFLLKGQAVDKDQKVLAAVFAVLDDRKLVDGKPVVGVQIVKIQEPELIMHLPVVLHV